MTYFIYEYFLNLDPYPSVADVFYFLFYVGIMGYLLSTIRYFYPDILLWEKILIGAFSSVMILAYLAISTSLSEDVFGFDFYYGIVFVIAGSITSAFSIFTGKIFRKGFVGNAWFLLASGIMFLVLGDMWYYYLELFGAYDLVHPVNLLGSGRF